MKIKIPLSELHLWWPAWSRGVPITFFGFSGRRCGGEGYEFKYDKELDVLTGTDSKQHLPISCATLCDIDDGELVGWESFSVIDGYKVQVNRRIPGEPGHAVDFYPIDALYIEGEGYDAEEE